jgi:hypothetical protein
MGVREITQGQIGYLKGLHKQHGMEVESAELKLLSFDEANVMIKKLRGDKGAKEDEARERMGKKIIHFCCLLGMTNGLGEADYGRINTFIENIGSKNPRKVKLWHLRYKEMYAVLNQVEKMYEKELNGVRDEPDQDKN